MGCAMRAEPMPSTWGPPDSQLRVRAGQLREADRFAEVLRRQSEPSLDRWADALGAVEQELPLRDADGNEPARVGKREQVRTVRRFGRRA